MTLTELDLAQFSGTENIYSYPFFGQQFFYTDGINYLVKKGKIYWLLDAIFSWQIHQKVKQDSALQEFQIWLLEVNNDRSCQLTCLRDFDDPVVTQSIPYTDFPLKQIKLYLIEKMLMLPREY